MVLAFVHVSVAQLSMSAGFTSAWGPAGLGQLADLFEIVFTGPDRSADARGVGAFKAAMVALGLLPTATMAAPVAALDIPHDSAVRQVVANWQAGARQGSHV